MKNQPTRFYLSYSALLIAALIWGSTFPMIKSVTTSLDPLLVVEYRYFIAALILGLYLKVRHIPLFTNYKSGFQLGVILWICLVPQAFGLKYTTATNSAFITGAFIIFLPIFYLFKRRDLLTVVQFGCALLCLTGVWLLTGGIQQANMGDGITLITAFGSACYIIIADKIMQNADPLVLAFQQFFIATVLSFIVGICLGIPFQLPDEVSLYVVLYLALFASIIATTLQLYGQKLLSPMTVGLLVSTEQIFAYLFSYLFAGERLSLLGIIGGILIFLSGILYSQSARLVGKG